MQAKKAHIRRKFGYAMGVSKSQRKEVKDMSRHKRGFAVLMTVILLTFATVGVSAEAMAGGGYSIGGGASAGGAGGAMNGDGAYAGNYSAGNEIAGNGAVGEGYNGNNAANRGGSTGNAGSGSSSVGDDMVTGAQDAAGIGSSTGTPRGVVSDTAAGNSMAEDDGGAGFVGIVVTVIIAIAVVLLIIALMPKKRVE